MNPLDLAEQQIAEARQITASGAPLRRNAILDRLHSAQDALREAKAKKPTGRREADRMAQIARELREINDSLGAPGSR